MSPGWRLWLLALAVTAMSTAPLLVQGHTESDCRSEAETGPCRGYFVRYFFNDKTKQCEEFVYGGCRGNGNNFRSKADCQALCKNTVEVERSFSWWRFW